jgi:hypothetical protein
MLVLQGRKELVPPIFITFSLLVFVSVALTCSPLHVARFLVNEARCLVDRTTHQFSCA